MTLYYVAFYASIVEDLMGFLKNMRSKNVSEKIL